MQSIALVLGLSVLIPARVDAEVRINTGALRFQEKKTTTTTTETIIGPKGTRVIRTRGTDQDTETPGTITRDSESEVHVEGVTDPGIKQEKRIYVPGQAEPIVVEPSVTGGPGSIQRKSSTKTTTTPKVEVRAR